MDKKPYIAPMLTQHGNAVSMTQGEHGRALELINFRPGPPFPRPRGHR